MSSLQIILGISLTFNLVAIGAIIFVIRGAVDFVHDMNREWMETISEVIDVVNDTLSNSLSENDK